MMYADNQYKWVVVLNRKVQLPRLLNAVAHLALGMRVQCKDEAAGLFHIYEDSETQLMSSISNWPVIVLQANNGNQLRTLRAGALAAGIPCQAFVDTMLGQSAADQIRRTKATNENNLEYVAVLLFGKADELQVLVKKFSLFAEPPTDTYGRGFHTLDPH
jgi:hypothetical protein